jgi:hypothetical protein
VPESLEQKLDEIPTWDEWDPDRDRFLDEAFERVDPV